MRGLSLQWLVGLSRMDGPMNGVELQNRELFAATCEGRNPNASVVRVLPCCKVLNPLEHPLNAVDPSTKSGLGAYGVSAASY